MKLKFPLHVKILIALILGALLGSLFPIDSSKLDISYFDANKKTYRNIIIENWSNFEFHFHNSVSKVFDSNQQLNIIRYFEKTKSQGSINTSITLKSNKKIYLKGINAISKVQTIATYIKPLGDLFIKLLSFLAIPLVIASLIVGAASLEDINKLGSIGGKTFAIYITTTAVAISIGLMVASIIKPGNQISDSTKDKLTVQFNEMSAEKTSQNLDIDIVDFILGIVPKNPIKAIAEGEMLQLVFFAVLFGITLNLIPKEYSDPVVLFFKGVSEAMIKMVGIIMVIAPYGVFALIASTIADFGFSIISTLFWYMFAVLFALLLQTTIVYGLIVKLFSKVSLFHFFKGMRTAQAIGFSTSSSAATLPLTIEACEKNLGVSKQVSGFVLPLGATINMDGTALYQGVAAVFIAQVYGMDLSIAQQLTIVFTAVLASIGTAPVPGVGIIMLVMILQSVHIPAEGIALIIGVDRVLDMARTITNITGDAAVAVAIQGGLDKKN